MRRGLFAWNPQEITQEALGDRVARLRAVMRDADLDAVLLYTNFVRPAAVAYLSSFTPYWADGLLLVQNKGRPLFATSMSTRMNRWIGTVNPIADIVNTPAPGRLVGERLCAISGTARVGVLELDELPNGIYGDLTSAGPELRFVEFAEQFAVFRRHVDDTERALFNRADALATAALDVAEGLGGTTAGTVVGESEKAARLGGAEEAYMALAPDLDHDHRLARVSGNLPMGARYAVRASVAYKGTWLRRVRTFPRDTTVMAAERWFEKTVGGLTPGTNYAEQFKQAARTAPDIELAEWTIEASVGTYPLRPIETAAAPSGLCPSAGAFIVVSARLKSGGHTVLITMPTILAQSGEG